MAFDGKHLIVDRVTRKGQTRTINSQTFKVYASDSTGVTDISGAAVPSDGGSGFAIGCKFRLTTGNGIGTTQYINEGSASSCDFNAVASPEVGDISSLTFDPGIVGGGASGALTGALGLSIRNETGGTLVKGTLVYISGYANSNYLVSKADANGAATLATFVLDADLNNNTNGTVYGVKVVTDINTDGAAAVGDALYLSETAGAFTATAPSNSNSDVQIVGRVITKHATTGSALFFPQYGIVTKFGSDHIQNQGVSGNALDAGAFTNGLTKNGSQVGVGYRVYNQTGGTLTPGTPVYISGYDGTNGLTVAKADADAGLLATHVVTASINNAAFGYVYAFATVNGQNTGGRTIGDAVYLDTTAGTYTFTAPTSGLTTAQIIGRVVTVDGANGSIEFFPALRLVTAFSYHFFQDGSIPPSKLSASTVATATADGTGSGAISGTSSHVVVTSNNATDQVSLPASSAALIGKPFTLWVGANGFEMITPAGSNATINGTDADGTNQADIPANSLSRVTLVAANTWILENIGSTGTVAAAIVPDND